MSQVLINQYLAELDRLKKVGGTHRESVVREAFKDLPAAPAALRDMIERPHADNALMPRAWLFQTAW